MTLAYYKQKYLDALKEVSILNDAEPTLETKIKQSVTLHELFQAKLAYARQFHGPSFNELWRSFDNAYKQYMNFSKFFDKERYDEMDEIILTNILKRKEQTEQDLFGCIDTM
jgi:hypothetical protein